MKKIISLIGIVLMFNVFVFADTFTTFPGSEFEYKYDFVSKKQAIKYSKFVSYKELYFRSFPWEVVNEEYFDMNGKSCFWRNLFYWWKTFENVSDGNINLEYLDNVKLSRKILGFEQYGRLLFVVHRNLLDTRTKDIV